jgi:FtsZ-interacting cell division protein ZipA
MMAGELIPQHVFILLVVIISAIAIIIVVGYWKSVRKSSNAIRLIEKEIELKKISMVEKDIETKRLMENRISLPKEQEDKLLNIRSSTTDILGDVGYLHNEVNERLTRLEAQTEQKKLEKILKDIERKEKELLKHKI